MASKFDYLLNYYSRSDMIETRYDNNIHPEMSMASKFDYLLNYYSK
jgi:hypothetical protein